MTKTGDFIGQRNQRLENLNKLRSIGVNPYPAQSKKDFPNKEIKDNYEKFEGKEVTLAGRLLAKRKHGKLIFGDLVDQSGAIQIAIKKDELDADLKNEYLGWDELKFIDVGDFIQVAGKIGKTEQGEITIFVKKLQILSKSLRPFPVKFDDKEQQFRRRYVDLVVNKDRFEMFERKAKFWEVSRKFMKKHGFIEVEVPVLDHVTGGADANPFVTHHNMLDQNFYLRISTELYQKRLIGGGFEKIFTIGPNFRNEGLSDEHLQEYTQHEWYWAYADYKDNMNLVANLFRELAQQVYGKTKFETRGHTFDLADEFEEIDYSNVIKEKLGIDIFEDTDEKMKSVLDENKVELSGATNRSRLIDNLWKLIRKDISGPAFLVNEPAFMSPLAKQKEDNPKQTERFHVIIAGSELGNGYSEINDPEYQLSQFLDQQKMRNSGDAEAQMLDIDYVEMLEYGMPPTSGYGQSERIFWFFENITAREGTLFPPLKHDVDNITKQIYPDINLSKNTHNPKTDKKSKSRNSNIDNLPSKEDAFKILEKHVKEPYQIIHAKMVAEAMQSYAKKTGENENLYYITGLLHDLDYFENPDEHPNESLKWFTDWKYPESLIHAVAAHAHSSGRTDTAPSSTIDYALIACDELSGLLYAYSLMRPTGFEGMKAKSVMKKFKDKSFAAKIDREEIMLGVDGLNLDIKDHIQNLIEIFKEMPELQKKP